MDNVIPFPGTLYIAHQDPAAVAMLAGALQRAFRIPRGNNLVAVLGGSWDMDNTAALHDWVKRVRAGLCAGTPREEFMALAEQLADVLREHG